MKVLFSPLVFFSITTGMGVVTAQIPIPKSLSMRFNTASAQFISPIICVTDAGTEGANGVFSASANGLGLVATPWGSFTTGAKVFNDRDYVVQDLGVEATCENGSYMKVDHRWADNAPRDLTIHVNTQAQGVELCIAVDENDWEMKMNKGSYGLVAEGFVPSGSFTFHGNYLGTYYSMPMNWFCKQVDQSSPNKESSTTITYTKASGSNRPDTTLPGLCLMGATINSATITQSGHSARPVTYMEDVDKFGLGTVLWGDRSHHVSQMTSSVCQGGTYYQPSVVYDNRATTGTITIDVESQGPITLCVAVDERGTKHGNMITSLPAAGYADNGEFVYKANNIGYNMRWYCKELEEEEVSHK